MSAEKNNVKERDRQVDKERRNNPAGNAGDAFNKENQGIIYELSNRLGFKGFLIFILIMMIIGICVRLFLV